MRPICGPVYCYPIKINFTKLLKKLCFVMLGVSIGFSFLIILMDGSDI